MYSPSAFTNIRDVIELESTAETNDAKILDGKRPRRKPLRYGEEFQGAGEHVQISSEFTCSSGDGFEEILNKHKEEKKLKNKTKQKANTTFSGHPSGPPTDPPLGLPSDEHSTSVADLIGGYFVTTQTQVEELITNQQEVVTSLMQTLNEVKSQNETLKSELKLEREDRLLLRESVESLKTDMKTLIQKEFQREFKRTERFVGRFVAPESPSAEGIPGKQGEDQAELRGVVEEMLASAEENNQMVAECITRQIDFESRMAKQFGQNKIEQQKHVTKMKKALTTSLKINRAETQKNFGTLVQLDENQKHLGETCKKGSRLLTHLDEKLNSLSGSVSSVREELMCLVPPPVLDSTANFLINSDTSKPLEAQLPPVVPLAQSQLPSRSDPPHRVTRGEAEFPFEQSNLRNTILIRSKKQNKQPRELKIELQQRQSLLNCGIVEVKTTRESVQIECKTTKDKELIIENLQPLIEDQTITVIERDRSKFSLMFFNIPRGCTTEMFYELSGINSKIPNKDFDVPYWSEGRNQSVEMWEVVVPSFVAHFLLKQRFFYIGLNRVGCQRRARIVRCRRCQALGEHNTKKCPNSATCSFCSGEHEVSKCATEEPLCSNCWKSNTYFKTQYNVKHSTDDSTCPSFFDYKSDQIQKAQIYSGYKNF